jgi:uncharacterized membrane protein YeaQ/YmgE (transglycosylase-associated protein family)
MLTTLTWPGLAVLALVAGIFGGVSTSLGGRGRGGFVAAVLIALVGGVVGPWLARAFQMGELINLRVDDQPFPIISSAIGAAVAVTLLHLTTGPRLLRS